MTQCISKATGKELKAYSTKKEAEESARYSKKKYNMDLYPYVCDKCGKYHLAPKSSKINVKHNACSCRDSNGNPKALYGSKKDAQKQLEKSQKEQHVKLRIYKCPEKHGYHLTHTALIQKEKKSLLARILSFFKRK